MMPAIVFPMKEEAEAEARRVEAWAKENGLGLWVSIPIAHNGAWAVTLPDGYPTDKEVVDVNAAEPEQEEL
jgi:hypothetical protein